MTITLLVVDDHLHFRKAARSLLEGEPDFTLVGEAHDGETAVALVAELVPDVVLMDIKLPGMNGIEATRQILSANPDCVVLAMSLHTEPRLVEVALGVGAAGYVAKDAAGDDLVNAIRTVAAEGSLPAPRI